MTERVWLSWSSGKDSALALEVLRNDPTVELCGLITSINEVHGRVALHGVREELLRAQAAAIGLPLHIVPLPDPCSNADYEQRMAAACRVAEEQRVDSVAFGDLFLADIRAYRERQMASTGLEPRFPLWGQPTAEVARRMIEIGQRAVIVAVDSTQLSPAWVGKPFDAEFLQNCPPEVDPCGENGEFHSFVYDAPAFRTPLAIEVGEVVERDPMVFVDVVMRAAEPLTGSTS